MMSETEFQQYAAQGYNRIPIHTEVLADLDTPLSAYLKLADDNNSYLLESVVGGERFGRYSFIGLGCHTQIAVYGDTVLVLSGQRVAETHQTDDPLTVIQEYIGRHRVAPILGLPPFCGGLVGYFGFNTIQFIEPRLKHSRHISTADKDQALPDILLLQSEEIAVVDNVSGKLMLIVYADPGFPGAYRSAKTRLNELLQRLKNTINNVNETVVDRPQMDPLAHEQSTMNQTEFEAAVEQAKEYIRAGDIFQVVLSRRIDVSFTYSPLAFYRALRTINPSPYMFYFAFNDFHVVGASPEILVRLQGDKVTLRPIAGTRPRGKTTEEDIALGEELLADEKERAEHVQLLDLGRNDVGRIARIGSVKVTELMQIERYSHVMHIVSSVEGKLKKGLQATDVLRATFPAGTLSGAPKIRALEIIDELENDARGLYSGAVGYMSYSGDMDVCIAIRTAVIRHQILSVQTGAGIVADSHPATEWQETENKAQALKAAVQMVYQAASDDNDVLWLNARR